ncbi:Oidioi.mRNA.OKI2018_I69.chr1.g837.t1.cds [Oikopleura dioica]|uniref:Oidioi.mRNA.OKI2018_I69.chr1.g837.t1.cds n=1 Tax=Oikopleura dioica TaxID=34765 RepID=A0ABN7SRA4_OIKDI|nr:Oidioi.mRNA.OKI2018_I69.chr1.g837.t1.cds [Oikopleura dioica]
MSEYSHSEFTEPAPESFVSYEKESGDSRACQALSKEEITFLIRQEMGFYETELTSLKREQYQLRKKNDELVEKVSDLENQNENQKLTISALEERIELNHENQALSQKTIETLENMFSVLEKKYQSAIQGQKNLTETIENLKNQVEFLNSIEPDSEENTENVYDLVYENPRKSKNDEINTKMETLAIPAIQKPIHSSLPPKPNLFKYHTRDDVEPFLNALKDDTTNLSFKVLFSKPNNEEFFKGTFGIYYYPRLYHTQADEKFSSLDMDWRRWFAKETVTMNWFSSCIRLLTESCTCKLALMVITNWIQGKY